MCGQTSPKRSTANLKLEVNILFESASNKILTSTEFEAEVMLLTNITEDFKFELSQMTNTTLSFVSLSSGALDAKCPENSVPDYGMTVGCGRFS